MSHDNPDIDAAFDSYWDSVGRAKFNAGRRGISAIMDGFEAGAAYGLDKAASVYRAAGSDLSDAALDERIRRSTVGERLLDDARKVGVDS